MRAARQLQEAAKPVESSQGSFDDRGGLFKQRKRIVPRQDSGGYATVAFHPNLAATPSSISATALTENKQVLPQQPKPTVQSAYAQKGSSSQIGVRYSRKLGGEIDHDSFCQMIDQITHNITSLKSQVAIRKKQQWVPGGLNNAPRSRPQTPTLSAALPPRSASAPPYESYFMTKEDDDPPPPNPKEAEEGGVAATPGPPKVTERPKTVQGFSRKRDPALTFTPSRHPIMRKKAMTSPIKRVKYYGGVSPRSSNSAASFFSNNPATDDDEDWIRSIIFRKGDGRGYDDEVSKLVTFEEMDLGRERYENATVWLDSMARLIETGRRFESFSHAAALDPNFAAEKKRHQKLSEENDFWWSRVQGERAEEEAAPVYSLIEPPNEEEELRIAAQNKANKKRMMAEPTYILVQEYVKTCHQMFVQPISVFVSHPERRTLTLKSYGLGSEGCVALCTAISAHKSLTELNLQDNNLNSIACAALASAADLCSSLTSLDLSINSVGPSGGIHLAVTLGGMGRQGLVSLNLAQNSIEDRGTVAIARALVENTSLTKIDLSGNKIGPRGAIALGDMLARNEILLDLNLQWNYLRSASAVKFCQGMARNQTLRSLNLAWNGFGDVDTIYNLSLALYVTTTLTEIDLTHNRIADKAAYVLGHALERVGNLTSIRINHNPLGQRGARALMRSLQMIDQGSEEAKKVEMVNCSTSFTNPLIFDPINPAGNYTLDLADPYCRVVLHGLALLVHQGRGEISASSIEEVPKKAPKSFTVPTLLHTQDDLTKEFPASGIVRCKFSSARKPPTVSECLQSHDLETIRMLLLSCNSSSEVDSLVSMVATDAVLNLDQAIELISYLKNSHIRIQFVKRYIVKILISEEQRAAFIAEGEREGVMFSLWRTLQQKLLSVLSRDERRTFFQYLPECISHFHPNNVAGHYKIDLTKEREVAVLLMGHRNAFLNEANDTERQPQGQMPNNPRPERVFLNFTIDSQPQKMNKYWKLPEEGVMELDVYNITHPPDSAKAIHDMEINIFLDEMGRCPEESVRLNAVRHIMNENYFTTAQVKRIMDCLEEDHNSRTTLFFEIYSRIIDYHGYQDIYDMLDREEQKEVRERMGVHTLFDEVSACTFYQLDLAQPGDRWVCAHLVRLAILEPGENMDSCVFNDLPFDVPGSWANEIPARSPGMFSVYYCRTDQVINKICSREKQHTIPPHFRKFQRAGNEWVGAAKRSKIKEMLMKKFQSPDEMFYTIDSDGGGSLSRQELARGLRSVGVYLEPIETTYLMEFLDEDGSGEIEIDEVISFWNSTK